jgi:hypothetical protein
MTTYNLERNFVPRLDIANFQSRWVLFCARKGPNPLQEDGVIDASGKLIERWVEAGAVDLGKFPGRSIEQHLAALKTSTGAKHRVKQA